MPSSTNFDQVLHGLQEAFDYLNRLVESDASVGYHPGAESARDNIGNALDEYRAKTEQGHVVISGNLSDGFTLYGPYADFAAAADFADQGAEVWIMRLHTPEQATFDYGLDKQV